MNYLFFDTETTGLPKNYKAPYTDSDNWPRLVQLAWVLTNNEGEEITAQEMVIRPQGYTIPQEASDIHRVTQERAIDTGVPMHYALNSFYEVSHNCAGVVIAHNLSFDQKIMQAEFHRKSMEDALRTFDGLEHICTMKSSTAYCQLPGNYGYKWPQLQELHQKLFGEQFEEAHDALADVRATVKCFWELVGREVIALSNEQLLF